jgi:metal iron transporter
MPHSLFLGSALAAQDRLSAKLKSELPMPTCSAAAAEPSSVFRMALMDFGASLKHALVLRKTDGTGTTADSHREHENRSLANVTAHLGHAIVDMIFSLLGFAVVINSL